MIEDGSEAAFPIPWHPEAGWSPMERGAWGMSLRDYFAGQILMGVCGRNEGGWLRLPEEDMGEISLIWEAADAMLRGREPQGEK